MKWELNVENRGLDFFGSFCVKTKMNVKYFLSLFWEQKSNQKTLVFDFRRSKLVSVIQYFKSFAPQTVKHFNHLLQLFDTRLQIIWHFSNPFFNTQIHFLQRIQNRHCWKVERQFGVKSVKNDLCSHFICECSKAFSE